MIHHTNCGMELFTDGVLRENCSTTVWKQRSLTARLGPNPKHGEGASAGRFIKWHTITDQPSSVVDDVRRIRQHPLVSSKIPIYGYLYDVHSGNLIEVKEAADAGRPH